MSIEITNVTEHKIRMKICMHLILNKNEIDVNEHKDFSSLHLCTNPIKRIDVLHFTVYIDTLNLRLDV